MPRKILVPFDGSEPAELALKWALLDAHDHGFPIKVMYVVDRSLDLLTGFAPRETVLKELKERGEKILEEAEQIAGELGVDVKIEKKVCVGIPWREIVREAEDDEEINLIVMGSHGRTGPEHAILGSVAENVIRHSPVNVLVVKREKRVEDSVEESSRR
ncbi:universal stress protein [Methanopyrus kandleri]|uniref:Predicted nucleotide-binding protein related to universal stress protein UspA n=2 Tax=Methanopyrus kandleri TaxID=2320 RepID=Q8TYZ9_METKA|nr:universal stress protein [Methanopyrus kandleri]AAM01359.1 Predicted nucleotide-binding protein related to universal stress protein UspA [Methanopyrus kandleri AV19]HII70718.1 universal stress protein [Methanopyrus kandleri]